MNRHHSPFVETLEPRRLLAADFSGTAAAAQDPGTAALSVPFQPAVAAPATKIMFLGDSITAAKTPYASYRYWLYNSLQSTGYNVDFVGPYDWTHGPGPEGKVAPPVAFDSDHYSRAGVASWELLNSLRTDGFPGVPDIAVIMLGNNDLAANRTIDEIIGTFGEFIDELRLRNPNVKIILTQIVPNGEVKRPDLGPKTVALNAQIPVLAAARSTAQSPVIVVDQHTGYNLATDAYDDVGHPNEIGEKKIAAKFATALKELMGGTTVPETGNLRGTVFLDSNQNGVRDADEAGIPGRFVFLDYNNNGRREQDEPITVTSKIGNYLFRDLPAGTHLVRHFLGLNAKPSDPAESTHQADVAGIPTTSYEFGVTLTSRINGFVFQDYNGDGARNGYDYNMAGRFVYIDANSNGVFDHGEPVAATNSIGRYVFNDLPPGDYVIRVVARAAERPSAPTNGLFVLNLAPGEFYNGATFGLASL